MTAFADRVVKSFTAEERNVEAFKGKLTANGDLLAKSSMKRGMAIGAIQLVRAGAKPTAELVAVFLTLRLHFCAVVSRSSSCPTACAYGSGRTL
eukprot:scaffold1448_cov387-Prasinococcus_capsulatus_cf.AAC.7